MPKATCLARTLTKRFAETKDRIKSSTRANLSKTTDTDLKRAFAEDGELKTHVGGQALLEGVMMRGKYNWAVAVRESNGEIYLEEHDLPASRTRKGFFSWPFVRGCVALVESLALGFKALEIAGEHAFNDHDESDGASCGTSNEKDKICENTSDSKTVKIDKTSDTKDDSEMGKGAMAVSMVLGVVLGIALFLIVPALITNLVVGEYDSNTIAWNIVDGILRVAVFIFYIWLIGHMSDIKRMFMYHGAEHKTIHCYEHGLPLTPENARSFPRLHVRCGTAFLIMVLVLAIIVYTIIPVNAIISEFGIPDGAPKLALVIAVRILFLPVIAGISYEITVKWAGSRPNNPLVKVILWPGLQMQYLTTNDPDDQQLECAIAAMQQVLQREETENGVAQA